MTPDREDRLRRAASTDPEVQAAYYLEAMADARRVVAASQPHRKDRPMSTPSIDKLTAGDKYAGAFFNIIAGACLLYLLIWCSLAHAWLPLAAVLVMYFTKDCWVAIRLKALDHSKGDSADWKKLAEQLEQHIRTTNPPTVPEIPEERK